MRYSILDPTGNITALVEDVVPICDQPSVAAGIMRLHPDVEQVGFVLFTPSDPIQAHLRMAGGEFCGNATMCAAALFAERTNKTLLAKEAAHVGEMHETPETPREVLVESSGADDRLTVRLRSESTDSFSSSLHMPKALGIEMRDFSLPNLHAALPLVRMPGISHIVIERSSPFYDLRNTRTEAERIVCQWSHDLGVDGLGLMFLEDTGNLEPLVYVCKSNTTFWEHSCASGSSAVGMYLATKAQSRVDVTLHEPGGNLRVVSDPVSETTVLHGHVRIMA